MVLLQPVLFLYALIRTPWLMWILLFASKLMPVVPMQGVFLILHCSPRVLKSHPRHGGTVEGGEKSGGGVFCSLGTTSTSMN